MIYPSHLQIEIVAGYCPAKCVMCPIDDSPRRQIMSTITFEQILTKFLPYIGHLKFTTIHGLGEPLVDKDIVSKVQIAKSLGFPSIGFATNAAFLDEQVSKNLITAGLDTIIFSIDGVEKQTHESIRIGIDFEEVVSNVIKFIDLRNELGTTKIIVRMIRQELNSSEWPSYQEFWTNRLDSNFGDQVSVFDVHNWGGGEIHTNTLKACNSGNPIICTDIYERFIVYADGNTGFCCGDDKGWFKLGNVLNEDPIDIYNSSKFNEYRDAMRQGNIFELEHCKDCSIALSRLESQYIDL